MADPTIMADGTNEKITTAQLDTTGKRVVVHCNCPPGGSHDFQDLGLKSYVCPRCDAKAEWVGPRTAEKAEEAAAEAASAAAEARESAGTGKKA